MRAALNQALHHAAHREAFGRRLAEHALMQNVLADMAMESEAATLLALRLARAFDRSADDERERSLMRLMTPIAKYWLCKRLPPLVTEAMECLGGNGYVEEAPLARLYREAPLHGIWEGSGNVICLDALRSIERKPGAVQALLDEIGLGGERLRRSAASISRMLKDLGSAESQARRIVETIALALQASLMVQHAEKESADAFYASRLEGDGGRAFGTLAAGVRCTVILERLRLTP
jgi:putative acyl-CoA dehydrogenase